MKWAMRYMLHKDNDEVEPDPFHIFLTGGAGVGETFLINVLIEKKEMCYVTSQVQQIHCARAILCGTFTIVHAMEK